MTVNLTTIEQILALHKDGQSIRSIANILGLDKSKVQRIIKKALEEEYDDTAEVSEDDTDLYLHKTECNTANFDTVIQSEITEEYRKKPPVSHQKLYTKAELVSVSEQMWRYKLDLNDYITYMSDLHDGGTSINYPEYESFPKRARRLIQGAKFIADQINVDYEELLVTQVLYAIIDTLHDAMKNGERTDDKQGMPWIEVPPYDTHFWLDSKEEVFLHPVI